MSLAYDVQDIFFFLHIHPPFIFTVFCSLGLHGLQQRTPMTSDFHVGLANRRCLQESKSKEMWSIYYRSHSARMLGLKRSLY